jgi:hypothetical protein
VCPGFARILRTDPVGSRNRQLRAALDPVLARNVNLRVSAKVASNHSQMLRKEFRAVAAGVRETAPVGDQCASSRRTTSGDR